MEKGTNLIFGITAVLERLKARSDDIIEILIAQGGNRPSLRTIEAMARGLGVAVVLVDPAQLSLMARGTRHQGVLARVTAFDYLNFNQLTEHLRSSVAEREQLLILDSLTDPRNFGALLRTAEAVAIRHVVIPKDRAVDVTPTVARASSGAVHHLNIYKVANLRQVVLTLKDFGFWIVGLDSKSAHSIYETVYPHKLAVVLGSEGQGIRPLLLRECDFQVSIPMLGNVRSLNVAVAGAVFLYEIVRQQRGGR